MNRSLQSIAALLVSLSGAMLAVTWVPADGLRRPPVSDTARRRTATVPCGYATGRSVAREVGLPGVPQHVADDRTLPVERLGLLTVEIQRLLGRCREALVRGAALTDAPAAQAVRSALAQVLRFPPSGNGDWSSAGLETSDLLRRQIEVEYAAAELAAAGPAPQSWMTDALQRSASAVGEGMQALPGPLWRSASEKIKDILERKYNEVTEYFGWQETIWAIAADFVRQQRRMALREALLRELDERFLEIQHHPESPVPPKPLFRPKQRRVLLAAAEALKSLSQALDAAAEQLQAASRQDVAELHTPLQNKEEKR